MNMHKLLLLVCLAGTGICRAQPWQQALHYKIDVQLQPDTRTADCMWQLDYTNNSPDSLHSIWLTISPNAWKNDRTAYSEQLLQLRQTDFYFSDEAEKGYITRLSFRVNGKLVTSLPHPAYADVAELPLSEPIPPGASVHLESPYHLKLPRLTDRFGYTDNMLVFTGWYPRPAVYDEKGWHIMPTLAQGEIYQEAASFEVNIQSRNHWQVVSPARTALADAAGDYYQFNAARQIEFTWMAFKGVPPVKEPAIAGSSLRTDVQVYALTQNAAGDKSREAIRAALQSRHQIMGDYPYATALLVTGWPARVGYIPGWIIVPQQLASKDINRFIDAQLLQQYLYSININHRERPWITNGLINYLQSPKETTVTDTRKLQYSISRRWQQSFKTPADSLPPYNLDAITSVKAGMYFRVQAASAGIAAYDSSIKNSYRLYRFNRPPADWMPIPADSSVIDPRPSSIGLNIFPFRSSSPATYAFGLLPALGYNRYDGVMAGLLFHNIEAWKPKLEYIAAPLYGFGSKKLAGLAEIRYNWYGKQYKSNWQAGVRLAAFSMNQLSGSLGNDRYRFSKIAPYLRWQLPEADPWSYRERSVAFTSYMISESELKYTNNNYSLGTTRRHLQQLVLRWKDDRILYPYDYHLQIDHQRAFTRLAFTGKYFFNYSRAGRGFSLRFFAGKFLYNQAGHNQFTADRYLLNLTGANGYEDYTYSDYFAGRNEFTGWQSQQIMERDGFFKVRTDLLNNKVGKTDNWLTAINMRTDIPDGINPLSLLPVRVPLRLFADIGTYGDAWSENYDGQRILFDAGLQLSLLYEAIHIYVPVVASKPFRDYNKSVLGEKRFWKTISFSVRLEALTSKLDQSHYPR